MKNFLFIIGLFFSLDVCAAAAGNDAADTVNAAAAPAAATGAAMPEDPTLEDQIRALVIIPAEDVEKQRCSSDVGLLGLSRLSAADGNKVVNIAESLIKPTMDGKERIIIVRTITDNISNIGDAADFKSLVESFVTVDMDEFEQALVIESIARLGTKRDKGVSILRSLPEPIKNVGISSIINRIIYYMEDAAEHAFKSLIDGRTDEEGLDEITFAVIELGPKINKVLPITIPLVKRTMSGMQICKIINAISHNLDNIEDTNGFMYLVETFITSDMNDEQKVEIIKAIVKIKPDKPENRERIYAPMDLMDIRAWNEFAKNKPDLDHMDRQAYQDFDEKLRLAQSFIASDMNDEEQLMIKVAIWNITLTPENKEGMYVAAGLIDYDKKLRLLQMLEHGVSWPIIKAYLLTSAEVQAALRGGAWRRREAAVAAWKRARLRRGSKDVSVPTVATSKGDSTAAAGAGSTGSGVV